MIDEAKTVITIGANKMVAGTITADKITINNLMYLLKWAIIVPANWFMVDVYDE